MTLREFVHGNRFTSFIMGVIVFNAIIIGIETYHHYDILTTLEWICVWIFVVEIVLKMIVAKPTHTYFRDPWNVFDFVIVAAAFIPAVAGFSTVLRILRVFRVLRLISVIPEMRLIVTVLARSLVSMTHIALLMGILFYIYAVIGVKLFGDTQPEYATIHETLFSLFRSMTAEDWTDLRYDGLDHGNYWVVTFYHVTWVLMSAFVMINLVIGAILNNYNQVQEIENRRKKNLNLSDAKLIALVMELNELLHARVEDPELREKLAKSIAASEATMKE